MIHLTFFFFFSVDNILDIQIEFSEIKNQIINTDFGKIKLVGKPKRINGVRDKFALELNGVNQFLNFGSPDSCLSKPEKCQLGIVFFTSIKFLSLKENSYLLTSCGDDSSSWGYAIYYKKQQLVFTVSTRTKLWTVSTSGITVNKIFDLEFSWSLQSGAKISVNGKNGTGKAFSFARKNKPSKNRKCDLLIGRSQPKKENVFSHVVIEQLRFIFASKDILEKLGFVIGELICLFS